MGGRGTLALCVALGAVACEDEEAPEPPGAEDVVGADTGAADGEGGPELEPLQLVAVTFNTGTTEGVGTGEGRDNGGYGPEQAALSDAWYGDGLAWNAAVDDVRRWFAGLDPPADVVAFQEIFWSGECPDIPEDAHAGFVCEAWVPGDATVAQSVLGEGFQVACHPGKPDKCLAVRKAFGRFRGCEGDLCLEGLEGAKVDGCGSGARVARGVVELVGDRAGQPDVTVVSVHGSSGFSGDDQQCRVAQAEQVFVDLGLGDGEPGANGVRNLVLGDLNTDPGRLVDGDASAARWHGFVGGEGSAFQWVTEVGEDGPATYGGVVAIDHVASDAFEGSCVHPGVSEGVAGVTALRLFDHVPAVCAMTAWGE